MGTYPNASVQKDIVAPLACVVMLGIMAAFVMWLSPRTHWGEPLISIGLALLLVVLVYAVVWKLWPKKI